MACLCLTLLHLGFVTVFPIDILFLPLPNRLFLLLPKYKFKVLNFHDVMNEQPEPEQNNQ